MRASGVRKRTSAVFETFGRDGARAPVVALNGFLGQPSMWSEVLGIGAGAEPAGLVLLGRLPGHGPDPWKPRAPKFEDVVVEMAESLPPIPPAWIIGYSMGARLALALALWYPQRFAGAVLVGVHPGIRDLEERAARAAWDEEQALAIERGGIDAFVTTWESLPLFATQRNLPPEVKARQRAARCAHLAEAVAASMRLCGLGSMPQLWDDLGRSDRRLVLVTGALDDKFGRVADEVVRSAPNAEHARVGGVGHNVALEDPASVRAILERCLGQKV